MVLARAIFVGCFASSLGAQCFAQALEVPDGGTVTLSSPATYSSVTVGPRGRLVVNARLTVTGDMTVLGQGLVTMGNGVYVMQLDVGGTLAVDLGGSIDVKGKGLPCNTTIDPASLAVTTFQNNYSSAGGSHVAPGQGASQAIYDDPSDPRLPGGGATCNTAPGTSSGGAVLVTASRARVFGLVRADGVDSSTNDNGGPAGGSINLSVGQFDGTGTLSARGGDGSSGSGPGAGGAVRVSYASSTFSGAVVVAGGGGDATSYAEGLGSGLFFDRATNTALPVAGAYPLRGGALFQGLSVPDGGTLDILGPAVVSTPLQISPGGKVTLSAPTALANLTLPSVIDGVLQVDADVASTTALLLRGRLVVNRRFTVPGLDTTSTARITHQPGVTSMHLVVTGLARVVPGALVDAVGLGLSDTKSINPVTGAVQAGSGVQNGGSHGGLGGRYNLSDSVAAVYDDPNNPVQGGGGGGSHSSSAGTAGGGVIRITAGALQLDGALVADSADPESINGVATGAGGSVVVKVGTLSGGGAILARGSQSSAWIWGGGGGGLIFISRGASTFSGTKSAAGGAGEAPGAAGVIVEVASSVAPTITSTAPTSVEVGAQYSYTPVASGSTPMTWALAAGPPGAAVDAASGAVRWTPSGEGAAAFDLEVSNAFGVGHQVFSVAALLAPGITSAASALGLVGQAYHYDGDDRPTATGTAPLRWALSLAPPGMSIDADTAQLSWVPATSGTFLACLEVANQAGNDSQCFGVSVAPPTQLDGGVVPDLDGGGGPEGLEKPRFASLPNTSAHCGLPYRYGPTGAPAVIGAGPFTFSVAPLAGTPLPEGLSIRAATGELQWTPSRSDVGFHPLELRVESVSGSDRQVFAISVSCEASPPPLAVGCGCSATPRPLTFLLGLLVASVLQRRGQGRSAKGATRWSSERRRGARIFARG